MKKKGFMGLLLAVGLVVSSSVAAYAAEPVTDSGIKGVGWWDANNTKSTPIAFEDGATVDFYIDVDPSATDDTYGAFCVEASDGTNYFTTTSAGDCWGAPDGIGKVIKDTGKADAVQGGSYHVVMTRDGNNFTATYYDQATGETMFGTLMFTGSVDFADTTVYVMGQVGTLTVKGSVAEAAATDTEATTTAATDTDSASAPKTGTTSMALAFGIAAFVCGAGFVAFRKRETR